MGDEASLEQWAEMAQAKEMLRACIRNFLGDEKGSKPHLEKLERRATASLLKAQDHVLLLLTGKGLEASLGPESLGKIVLKPLQEALQQFVTEVPRGLVFVADQGSTALAGFFYLVGEYGLLAELLIDTPHRFCHSDTLCILQSYGWGTIILPSLLFTVNYGPYNTPSWSSHLKCV